LALRDLLEKYPGALEAFGWIKGKLKGFAKNGLLYYRSNTKRMEMLISEDSFRRLLDFTVYQRHYAKAIKRAKLHARK